MPPKGISSVTLGLRFMQNAARVEEAEAAAGPSGPAAPAVPLQDDSHWEIAGSAKEGWGILSPSTPVQQTTVVHEQSYLPFLFSQGDASTSSQESKVRGRRKWNKRGQEVLEEEKPPALDVKSSVSLSQLSSISGSAGGYIAPVVKAEKKFKLMASVRDKTALQAISSGGVGTDLHRSKDSSPDQLITTSSGFGGSRATFLKPAGVDMPSVKQKSLRTDASDTITNGKRAREGQDNREKRRKKNKKVDVKAEE
ncbi:hypothetical protein K488DRAFT_73663 [Vararia minispora EC-137]|uniref:Uncharacterized protein n=1 Tax=Vararia minispora EC-137 TaxID=1314806 RepID=A0ACB8QA77_9AGAM|nr:hypothetical protein K488DRAFT_73663 [Vararia minispora EC-137]